MALPTDNPALFPVGLGGIGFGLEVYNKRNQEQPLEKARVGTGDLVGNERLNYWTQDDYSGGAFQYEWSDPAMVAEAIGVLPHQLARALRAQQPAIMAMNASDWFPDWQPGDVPLAAFCYGDSAFFCFSHYIGKIRIKPDGSYVQTKVSEWTETMQAFWLERETDKIFAGCNSGRMLQFKTNQGKDDAIIYTGDVAGVDKDGNDISGALGGLAYYGDKLFGVFGRHVHVLDVVGQFWTPVGSTDTASAGMLPAKPVQMIPYNSVLIILCGNAQQEGYVCSTTGADVATIMEVPFAVTPRCATVYAGRLFIGCGGYDLDGSEHHAELFELSGTSLRLVRTFTPEKMTGRQPVSTIRWMDVIEGLLWFPNPAGRSLVCYDASTDGFYTGLELPWVPAIHRYKPVIAIGYRSTILTWVDDADGLAGIYRTRKFSGEWLTEAQYLPYIVTSDFGPEPARVKNWSELVVETRFRGCAPVYASNDGGTSWTLLTFVEVVNQGTLYFTRWKVPPAMRSRRIRFKIGMPTTTNGTGTQIVQSEFISHTLSFAWNDNGKHGWQLTFPMVERWERMDGSVETTVAPQDYRTQLWSWADSGAPITFRDRDGSTFTVMLTQCVESEPFVRGNSTERESYFSTYLVEV